MKPDKRFARQDKSFWACVRSLSQEIGYTVRKQDRIKVPSLDEMKTAFITLELNASSIIDSRGRPTERAQLLQDYFVYRAMVLDTMASKKLMNAQQALALFEHHRKRLNPSCPLPMNKQKGDMKALAFLTGLVNMMVGNCPGRTLGFAIDRSRADVSQGVDDIARGHLQTGQRRFDLGTI